MIKILVVILLSALLAVPVFAQADDSPSVIEITPIVGYTFGGTFVDSVTGTNLDLEEGESYGIILDINKAS